MSTHALTNLYVDDAYPGLLHSISTGLPSTDQQVIYDGVGNASALSLGRSGNGAKITGTVSIDNLVINNKQLFDIMRPVGSIYFSSENTTPLFDGRGTWVRISAGRCIGAVGTGIDINGDSHYIPPGNDAIGETEVTLTIEQTPKHRHTLPSRYADNQVYYMNVDVPLPAGGMQGLNGNIGVQGWEVFSPMVMGNRLPDFTLGNQFPTYSPTHDNIPPCIGLYIYQRTA
jgi:hypothetical protein